MNREKREKRRGSRKDSQEQQECAAYGARHQQVVFRSLRSSRPFGFAQDKFGESTIQPEKRKIFSRRDKS